MMLYSIYFYFGISDKNHFYVHFQGSIVPDGTTNCVQNATLTGECETCLCNSNGNATLCKSSCDNFTVINGGNNNETHIETNQVCRPNEVRTEVRNPIVISAKL